MWYAVQVMNGREEKVAVQCEKLIGPDILEECFLPRFEKLKRYQGAWHKVEALLFPGYVFMVSDKPEELKSALHRIPELTKILGDSQSPVALYHEEVELLLQFGGQNNHLVELSTGYIEGDRVVVVQGPMVGHEGTIKKVDRHKRLAILDVYFFGRKMDMKVGLEIIEKREPDESAAAKELYIDEEDAPENNASENNV